MVSGLRVRVRAKKRLRAHGLRRQHSPAKVQNARWHPTALSGRASAPLRHPRLPLPPSIVLDTGHVVVQTVATKNFRSLCPLPVQVQRVRLIMVLQLLAAQGRASAQLILIAKENGKLAVLLARRQPRECGVRYGRRLVREQLVQRRQTAYTAKVLAKRQSTAWAGGPSARQIVATSGSRYPSGHLRVDEAVCQGTATWPVVPQVKELAHPILIAKENGLAAQRLAKKLLNGSGCRLLGSLGKAGSVLLAQTAGTETVDA